MKAISKTSMKSSKRVSVKINEELRPITLSDDAEKMRKKYLHFFAAAATAVCMLNACSHKSKTEEPVAVKMENPSPEARYAAIENGAEYVKEITFAKGSSQLTPTAQAQLDRILENAAKLGKIDDIKVISWADREYPSIQKKKLAKKDQELADQRNQEIEKYIQNNSKNHARPDVRVETYNMAKRPNSLQKLFGTSSARIKKSLEEAGIPTDPQTTSKIANKSSKAIVMIAFDESTK